MSRRSDAEIIWAVLASVPSDELGRRAARAWREKYGDEEEAVPAWEVVPGEGEYSAVVGRAGSEGDDEGLAEEFSREDAAKVYLLRLRDEGEAVWAYEDGELTEVVSDDPQWFAASLRCPLPGTPAGPLLSTAVSLCVVEGATADEVVRALGEYGDRCQLAPTSAGVLVHSETISTGFLVFDIAAALPHAAVYGLTSDPSSGRFGVLVLKGGKVFGNFETPHIKTSYPELSDVKGETSPLKIASALGVAPELLRLKGSP
jgi:hypothetical protein